MSAPTVNLMGMELATLTQDELLDHMFAELRAGRGGWLVTANLDFLRRYSKTPRFRELYAGADLRVADGMPLVWAARLQGDECPERVTGATLVETLAQRSAREGRRLALLGGVGGAAEETADRWQRRFSDLQVAGTREPWIDSPPTEAQVREEADWVQTIAPDVLLVGLGSPKQEYLIRALRPAFPGCWMVGVGISFSFASGRLRRAPMWMQAAGLEWTTRLAAEPRRLARRYLWEDLPFAGELFARSAWVRIRRRFG